MLGCNEIMNTFIRILAVGLLVCSLAFAQTYKFQITEKVQIGQTELKPGSYTVDVDGTKAVLKDKKGNTIDVKATVAQAPTKVNVTTFGFSPDPGTPKLTSVILGGTTIRVVFE